MATTKYEFKEKGFNDDGSFSHYVTPRADPKVYEDPFDYIFDTKKEALAFIREQVEEECIEAEEVNNWVLVKVTTTEINVKLV
jgi:hypothetical protein